MKDFNRQRQEMVENVKGKINRAKEMCEERLISMGRHGHEHVRLRVVWWSFCCGLYWVDWWH